MSKFKNAETVIKFKAATYTVSGSQQTISFPDVDLETALITVTKVKKVVRGEIMDRDGEVIEYIGMGSSEVNIVGTITGDNGIEPVQQVIDLNKVIDAPISLDIICPYLNQKGIQKLVILDSTLPQDPGGISYQTFNINAISEIPTELRISGV
jgi:hypothetical protein